MHLEYQRNLGEFVVAAKVPKGVAEIDEVAKHKPGAALGRNVACVLLFIFAHTDETRKEKGGRREGDRQPASQAGRQTAGQRQRRDRETSSKSEHTKNLKHAPTRQNKQTKRTTTTTTRRSKQQPKP